MVLVSIHNLLFHTDVSIDDYIPECYYILGYMTEIKAKIPDLTELALEERIAENKQN